MVRLGVNNIVKNYVKNFLFQFQYGSIGRYYRAGGEPFGEQVSIPVWFDWESKPFDGSEATHVGFNSSMVRL